MDKRGIRLKNWPFVRFRSKQNIVDVHMAGHPDSRVFCVQKVEVILQGLLLLF
jgi:hypothetical protein